MGFRDVVGHVFGWNDVILKGAIGFRGWDPGQNPEERRPEIAVSLQPDAARLVSGQEGLHLDMDKLVSDLVAAEHIDVRGVAQRDNRRVTPATQLPSYEELTGVASKCLVVLH